MRNFERFMVGEGEYTQEIVAGILHAQARFANAQHRPLGRGTHTKGVCVRGTFEVHDLAATIADPALRARLSQGFFARPGTYPATIRFANADSKVAPDSVDDVRAISFSVELPAGVAADVAVRHDFSMNNGPTFPINDVRAFAMLLRVLEADGAMAKLKAFLGSPLRDMAGFLATAIRGKLATRNSVHPYQSLRYWSTVPFRHGPDEAAKYSLAARPDNLARVPEPGDNMLRDELLRHVDVDPRMSAFDFQVQLLEPDVMTRGFFRRDPTYWVENASVEWKESQAPFHTVGTLRLLPGSQLDAEASDAFYVDVVEHSTPETHPIGSLNRARWFAESASRKARLQQHDRRQAVDVTAWPASRGPTPLPAPPSPMAQRLRRVTRRSLGRAALLLLLAGFVGGSAIALVWTILVHLGVGALPEEPVARVEYPDNGFGAGLDARDRQTFYYTPQGAGLKGVRYAWFVHLEMPFGTRRLADPAIMRRYGFLVDEATERNPDQLPVGFTRHYDTARNEEMLDITCAACHTGQIAVRGPDHLLRAVRIDGGQANHAFTGARLGQFLPTLIVSLAMTTTNPFKFNRFANRVIGRRGLAAKWRLYRELWGVNWTFLKVAYHENVWPHNRYPTQEGFGRTDALARIGNTVFGEYLSSANFRTGNAPVSYPSLWNIWKLDWVQYNASVSQPMARNIGEAMGVGATYDFVDPYGNPLPPSQRFRATVRVQDLTTIERTLWKLRPPAWNEALMGTIDRALADSGKVLFNAHCVGCHGPHVAPESVKKLNAPLKGAADPEWLVAVLCTDDIGTDPNAARNFTRSMVDLRRTGLTAMDLRAVALNVSRKWNARRATHLQGEIARLSAFPDSAATVVAMRDTLSRLDAIAVEEADQIHPERLPLGAALSYVGMMVREKAYDDANLSPAQRDTLDGFGIVDRPRVIDAYKSKPLAGIWATPPFLHNGSVPTIYELLSPVAERSTTFQVGSREYDTKHLGLAKVKGFWTLDTRKDGNHNTGHEFASDYDATAVHHDCRAGGAARRQPRPGLIGPLLSDYERRAIIEHLKVRDDDRDAPQGPHRFPTCGCG